MRVSEQDVQDASRQVDAARGESVAASNERSAVLTEAFTKGLTKLRSSRSSTGSTSSSYEQLGESLNKLDQISRSVADSTGLTQAQVARVALGASGEVGVRTPFAGLHGEASVEKNYSAGLSAEEQRALHSLSSDQIAAFKQFGDRATRDSSFVQVLATDAREAQDLSARLASSAARSERADASLSERTAFAERVSSAHERGDSIAIDIAQDPHNLRMFTRYAEQYGGDSASAQVLMASELARQSLRPNRVFSDGTALPTTFGDLNDQHRRDTAGASLAPDLAAQHQANREAVERSEVAQSRPRSGSTRSALRESIRADGAQIRADVAEDRTHFDRKAQVTSTPDGTLATESSLVKRSVEQVQHDASPVVDDAKRALKEIFKK